MPFVAARCPQCGGELQLDDGKETGFCMHCGSKIVISSAIRAFKIDSSHMIANWMKLGLSASDAKNYEEAYQYFGKILEVDPENWEAFFHKGHAAGWQTSTAKPRFNELFEGIRQANLIIGSKNIPLEEKISIYNMFAVAIYSISDAFFDLVVGNLEGREDLFFDDFDFMWETRAHIIKCISYQETALSLLEPYHDTISEKSKIGIKKSIAEYCAKICDVRHYWFDYQKEDLRFFGYSAKEKKPFVDKYDETVIEIRMVEPDFRTHSVYLIDRLDQPENHAEWSNRNNTLTALEPKIRAIYKVKEDAIRKRFYWEEHPEEYQAFQEREKQKEEEKENLLLKLKADITEKQIGYDDFKKQRIEEIKKLMYERDMLNIFQINKKKQIDEVVISIRANLEDFKKSCGLVDAINRYEMAKKS